MINNRFLYYKNLATFTQDLNNGQINRESIVFIEETKLIWTHGVYFGSNENQELPDLENYVTDTELDTVLNNYATKQDLDQYQPIIHDGEDEVKHIFLTLEEYQALEQYQDNTIYFILEPKKTWTFGSTFPIVFTEGLGTFPITLT